LEGGNVPVQQKINSLENAPCKFQCISLDGDGIFLGRETKNVFSRERASTTFHQSTKFILTPPPAKKNNIIQVHSMKIPPERKVSGDEYKKVIIWGDWVGVRKWSSS